MMESVLVLHLADTHLGYRQYNIYERELDIYDAFDEATEIAIREHVDLVLHSGDFFDTPKPPPQAIRRAIRALRRLREKNIPFIAILGDHDIPKRRGEHPLAVLEEVGLARIAGIPGVSERLWIKTRNGVDVFVAGLVHHRATMREKLLARLQSLTPPEERKPRILLLHQAVEGTSPEYELALSELPRGYSYYALGHIHRPGVYRVWGTIAVYPGSIDALRIDEVYDEGHGVVIAEVGVETASSYFERLTSLRPQVIYRIEYNDKLSTELARIASRVSQLAQQKKPLVHLVIEGVDIDRQRVYKLVQRLFEKNTLYTHLVFHERAIKAGNVEIDATQGRLDRLEILKKLIGDEELAKLADDLIEMVALGASDYELRARINEFFRKRYGPG